MDKNNKDHNRIWYLQARKTAGEISQEENEELTGLLQEYPFTLYIQEIVAQQWHDSYKHLNEKDIDAAWERHLQKLDTKNNEAKQEENLSAMHEAPGKPRIINILIKSTVAVAASVLIVLSVIKWLPGKSEQTKSTEPLQQLATQNGSRSQLVLPDGTKVWLNAGSKLDYPKQFQGKMREVNLQGEAYFDVTHNQAQPFLVHTKAFTVKVLGTSFNVRAYADEDSAATSLIKGSVEIQLANNANKKVLLRPSEKLTVPVIKDSNTQGAGDAVSNQKVPIITEIRKSIVSTDKSNAVVETAWVDNKLAFKGMNFGQTAQVLEKWFAVDIRFKNTEKKKLRLNGTFVNESLDEILTAFSLADINGGKQFSYKKDSTGVIWIY